MKNVVFKASILLVTVLNFHAYAENSSSVYANGAVTVEVTGKDCSIYMSGAAAAHLYSSMLRPELKNIRGNGITSKLSVDGLMECDQNSATGQAQCLIFLNAETGRFVASSLPKPVSPN